MHKNDESADVMTEKMVEEVETKVAEDDAMLARRISEAKRLAESAKNENDPSSCPLRCEQSENLIQFRHA